MTSELNQFEYKKYSQNDEDGTIGEIFTRISPLKHYFVEFGVENGLKYNPYHVWDGTSYQGTSLQSLYELCIRKGYVLVATDSKCVNAFFVKEELTKEKIKPLSPKDAYHPIGCYGHLNEGKLGHPYREGEYVEV